MELRFSQASQFQNKMQLLTRDQFREAVFARDGFKCVLCKNDSQDAHHILERRLWGNGGYFIDNGASLCGPCHVLAEQTKVSVEEIREAAGITKIIVPDHLYPDQVYTKWGDPILANGSRAKGELFYDESIQKILKEGEMLNLYTDYIKYPRTYHLPFSESITDDDRIISDFSRLENQEIVISIKKDGENFNAYQDYFHARSLDSRNHPSRNWVKNFFSRFQHDIPKGWRICGENLFAEHSIRYENLKSYFYGFSIWNDKNICLSWQETLEWFQLFNIEPVEVIYRGIFDLAILKNLAKQLDTEKEEGYVVRLAGEFNYRDFNKCVCKFVRKDHVRTVKHWMHGQEIKKNLLNNYV